MLNIKLVQERLKELAERDEKNCRPNLNASKFKRQAIQKQTRPNLNGTSRPNLNDDASKFKRNIDTTEIPSNIDSEEGEGADAPRTRAELVDDLKEIHPVVKQEVQRITDKHKAVQPNETSYHIAGGAIGNERVDTPGRLTLPSKPAVKLQAVAAGQAPIASLPIDAPVRQSTVSHTPGTPAPLPLAAGTAGVLSRHGDAGKDQASLPLDSEPAPA